MALTPPDATQRQPRLPIPEPLRGCETGSFAHHTVSIRLPQIARRVLEENIFSGKIASDISALVDEIHTGTIRPLHDPEAPDVQAWEGYTAPYLGSPWLEAPWFFAECYFFRRILQATGFFQNGPGHGIDPYQYQKSQGLHMIQQGILDASELDAAQVDRIHESRAAQRQRLADLLMLNLWGNQVDLSLWPAGHQHPPSHPSAAEQGSHLLADDRQVVCDYLFSLALEKIEVTFILDNAGPELVNDLLLADYLLNARLASRVIFHLKPHPTFVSDATVKDVHTTMGYLSTIKNKSSHALAQCLQDHLTQDRLILREHFFWTSPLAGWEIPADLLAELTQVRLIINKGDANYRRLLGDRHWPPTTPLEAILGYMPTPLLALRVSKSQVIAGVEPGQIEKLEQSEPGWMTNGRWGMIQYYHPS